MSNLIPVNFNSERVTVSGRHLHSFLEVATAYKDWFPRMCEYGFNEFTDYNPLKFEQVQFEGTREVTRTIADHQLTIEMAKEICMIQRSEKGKQARQYFIDLEKQWNSPEAVMARALKMADTKILSLQNYVSELTPKAEQFDRFISGDNYQTMNTVAKALGWGRNKLFEELRTRKILRSNNEPYQEFIDRGYFVVKERPIEMAGQVINKPQTFATAKGVSWLDKTVNKGAA